MNKLKQALTNNISLKLTSLAIAIVLWIIAINVNDPTITSTYNLPLELTNTENLLHNNLVILNEKNITDSKIDVQVQATRNDLKFINQNPDNLKAVINFKDVNGSYEKYIGDKFSMPVNISFSNYLNTSRYQITNVYPSKVDVMLDHFVTANEQIYYETDGDPANNYYIKNINVEPQNIKISGPQSIIKSIKPITLNFETASATKNISSKFPIKIYDKNDNEITNDLTLSDKEVKVDIEIDSYKTVDIARPETKGNVADGYELKNIDYEPKKVDIIGDGKNEINFIKLPPIDIENASLPKTITYDLNEILKNNNLQVKKGSTDKILVTIDIAKKQ